MASISAIQHDQELRLYYKSKVAEGKPKMIALNNVRNKFGFYLGIRITVSYGFKVTNFRFRTDVSNSEWIRT